MEVDADIVEFLNWTSAGGAGRAVGDLGRTRDVAGGAVSGCVSAGHCRVGRPATGAGSRPRSGAEMEARSGEAEA